MNSPHGSGDELIPVTMGEEAPARPKPLRLVGMILGPAVIGVGIAEAIHRATFDASVHVIDNDLRPRNLAYMYFAVVIFAWLTRWLNFFPMGFKNDAVASYGKQAKGNIRANMYLYTTQQATTAGGGLVVLEEGGAAGRYNRANRSLHHFVENAPAFMLCLPLAGFVYPAAAFVLAAVFALGRIHHQFGYATKGYGGHGIGFGVSLVATIILEGLVIVAGLRAAGVPL